MSQKLQQAHSPSYRAYVTSSNKCMSVTPNGYVDMCIKAYNTVYVILTPSYSSRIAVTVTLLNQTWVDYTEKISVKLQYYFSNLSIAITITIAVKESQLKAEP